MNAGADKSLPDFQGNTALHFAALSNSVDCAKLLVVGDAGVNVKNGTGDSAMIWSAGSGNDPELVDLMAAAGGDIMSFNGHGQTPLHGAACLDQVANCETLLALGADVNKADYNGDTPLFNSVQYGNPAAMDILLKQNIDFSHCNHQRSNIAYYLALYGNVEVLERLIPYIQGVDFGAVDIKGRTAF